jgi:hypothetical protein
MSPASQLDAFIAKFDPTIAAEVRKVLAAMRRRLKGAQELVYDNYNALAVGFGPTDRAGDIVFSIAVYPRWMSLFFFSGARLRDPQRVLKGTGTRTRHIVLSDGAATLAQPAVSNLIDQALKLSPLDPTQKRRLIIKSISARQKPRRVAG